MHSLFDYKFIIASHLTHLSSSFSFSYITIASLSQNYLTKHNTHTHTLQHIVIFTWSCSPMALVSATYKVLPH